MPDPHRYCTQEVLDEVARLCIEDRVGRVKGIKLIREHTHLNLKQAKQIADTYLVENGILRPDGRGGLCRTQQ